MEMKVSNKGSLVILVRLVSGVLGLAWAIFFMAIFLDSGRERETLNVDGILTIGAFTIVCTVIFVICLVVDYTDRGMKIETLEGEKRALLRGKEDVGHALAAFQNCILEGNKNVTALEMRMRVNTIVTGLGLPMGFDTEKLKEWKDKILSTTS